MVTVEGVSQQDLSSSLLRPLLRSRHGSRIYHQRDRHGPEPLPLVACPSYCMVLLVGPPHHPLLLVRLPLLRLRVVDQTGAPDLFSLQSRLLHWEIKPRDYLRPAAPG